MGQTGSSDALEALSSGLADAVARGGEHIVSINQGDEHASSGVCRRPGLFLSSDRAVGEDEGITITTADGAEHEAQVVGRDPGHDLVLLKTEDAAGAEPELRTEPLTAGEIAISLARPTDEGIQASIGIVNVADGTYRSWRGGSMEGVMRIDATRYPGYSGGATIDAAGRIAAINVLGDSGVAVPMPLAISIADRLEKGERMGRAYLGVRSQPVDLPKTVSSERERESGLLVVGVEDSGPAEAAGLMVGDIILAVGSDPVSDHEELLERLGQQKPGNEIEIGVIRGGETKSITVTLGARPRDQRRGHRDGPQHGHPCGPRHPGHHARRR